MPTRSPSLFIAALLAGAPALPAQESLVVGSHLQPQLDAWLVRANRIAPGKWGVVVADISGNVLWSINSAEPMVPASTVKVLTTGFARSVVGGDARRATRVVGNGSVDQATGVWMGRWALELNGDPTLERPDRSGPTMIQLAKQLASIGVTKLVGPLTVTAANGANPRPAYPAVWSDRYRGRSFAPLVGQVLMNEGLVDFTMGPGAKLGAKAVVVGDAPSGASNLLTITATTVAGTRSSLRFSAAPNGRFVVSGKIGQHGPARRFSVVSNDPMSVLEAVWQHATQAAGIQWIRASAMGSGDNPGIADQRVLAEIASETFDSVAKEINTRSLNIGAEMMLIWGGGAAHQADQLTSFVQSVTGITDGVHLVDGSGLSWQDRVSPIVFSTYLAKIPLTPGGKNFPLLLAANGSGTLRKLARGLPGPGVVRAKTGTLDNSATLVGYLGRNDGTLVIAAMYNGSEPGSAHVAEWDLFRTLGANGIVIPMDGGAALGGAGGAPAGH